MSLDQRDQVNPIVETFCLNVSQGGMYCGFLLAFSSILGKIT